MKTVTVPLYFPPMHKIIQEGESGDVKVIHFTVNKQESVDFLVKHFQFIPPGNYVELNIDEKSVMSDIPYEHYTNIDVARKATGRVLIAGLGIGMILTRILAKKDVEAVVIIEQNPDVIKLVSPCLERHFKKLWLKVQIVNCDAFEYRHQPKARLFDYIYTDIQFPRGEKYSASRKRLDRLLRKFLKRGGGITHWEGIETRIREWIDKGL